MSQPMGRRERKKAQTRQALADAALEMFLTRGYEQVGVRDVADAADVSVTTLFKYFPSKEALVFDLHDDLEAGVVAAVHERKHGQSIPQALCDYISGWVTTMTAAPQYAAFARLVDGTPALQDYACRVWRRHADTLADAIAEESGIPKGDTGCVALARFALQGIELAHRQPDPVRSVGVIFALLEKGWSPDHSCTERPTQ
jgi:AcrR family transcriptional regulator